MSHLLCLGLGFAAKALAVRMAGRGWHITGTSRSQRGTDTIRQLGYAAALFDGIAPSADVARALATATHVLISVPPGSTGDRVLGCHRADLAAAPRLAWIGYLSTVGVYGDHGGAWVDETTPATPGTERSRRRLAAEQGWLALGRESGRQVQVFRLAGIYGPGRSAIDSIRDGTARRIVKPGQVFNRIHADDIASALEAAMTGRGRHAIYNVADDEPAPPQDVIAYAAALLAVAPPPEITLEAAGLSAMAASFYAECKRVRNTRLEQDLGLVLQYPSYREGLRAVVGRS